MDAQTIMSAISTVGFPIVMSLILLYIMYQQNEQHKEEMDNLKDALNNNTLALQHLADMMARETNA